MWLFDLRSVSLEVKLILLTTQVYTACFNMQELYILPTEYICVFRMVLTVNSDCFRRHH